MRAAAARRPRFPSRVSGTPDKLTGIKSTRPIVIPLQTSARPQRSITRVRPRFQVRACHPPQPAAVLVVRGNRARNQRTRARARLRLDGDRAVVVKRPAWIVGNLPHVSLWIGECTGCAAPVSATGGTNDAAAGALCLGQYGTHLFGRSHVVGEFDPGCAVTAERSPEPENHAAGLKEADLVIGLVSARPAERLVELTSTGKILDTERHQADALFHGHSIAATAPATRAFRGCRRRL